MNTEFPLVKIDELEFEVYVVKVLTYFPEKPIPWAYNFYRATKYTTYAEAKAVYDELVAGINGGCLPRDTL